jgi:hypothetical protein
MAQQLPPFALEVYHMSLYAGGCPLAVSPGAPHRPIESVGACIDPRRVARLVSLQRFFAKYEFTSKYLLCCSDCETLSMQVCLPCLPCPPAAVTCLPRIAELIAGAAELSRRGQHAQVRLRV